MRSKTLVLLIELLACLSAIQAREIPISDFVASTKQDGMQGIGSGRSLVEGKIQVEDYSSAMRQLSQKPGGASNVLLVDAINISDVVKASAGVLAGYRRADKPAVVPYFNPDRGKHWLVAYLGGGHSEPRSWVIDGASIDGTRIRLTYQKPKAKGGTEDVVPYYYWVPLGKLDDGVYNLELYDSELKAVTLMRRVEIKAGD